VYFNNIVLYGAGPQTCTKRGESKIQAIEMKFLRVIMGMTKTERIRIAYIRKSSGRIYSTKSREIH
jgi:hypothetical protein